MRMNSPIQVFCTEIAGSLLFLAATAPLHSQKDAIGFIKILTPWICSLGHLQKLQHVKAQNGGPISPQPPAGQGSVPGGAPQRPRASESHWTHAPLHRQLGHRSLTLLKAWEGAGTGDGPSLWTAVRWCVLGNPITTHPATSFPASLFSCRPHVWGQFTSQSYLGSGLF